MCTFEITYVTVGREICALCICEKLMESICTFTGFRERIIFLVKIFLTAPNHSLFSLVLIGMLIIVVVLFVFFLQEALAENEKLI